MTEQFKVGEIAIICNVEVHADLEGQECEIVGGLELRRNSRRPGLDPRYLIQVPDGRKFVPQPHQLRKKRRPPAGEQSIMVMFKRAPQRNPVPA